MLFVPRFCSSAGRFSTSRAAADGLVDPLTVQVEQQIPPTDRQMDYVLEFEVMIPDGVCKDDVSAIIFSDPRRLPVYDALRACGAAVADLQAIVGAAGCLTAGAAAGVGGSESRRLASARMISTVPSDD